MADSAWEVTELAQSRRLQRAGRQIKGDSGTNTNPTPLPHSPPLCVVVSVGGWVLCGGEEGGRPFFDLPLHLLLPRSLNFELIRVLPHLSTHSALP